MSSVTFTDTELDTEADDSDIDTITEVDDSDVDIITDIEMEKSHEQLDINTNNDTEADDSGIDTITEVDDSDVDIVTDIEIKRSHEHLDINTDNDTEANDSDTDTITGIEMNCREPLDSAPECNAGSSPLVRGAILAVDFEATSSSVADNAKTQKEIRQRDQRSHIPFDLSGVASLAVDSENTASSVANKATTEMGVRRSHRRTRKNTADTSISEHGIQKKKRASSGRRQLFDFSRIGDVRQRADGQIEYEIKVSLVQGDADEYVLLTPVLRILGCCLSSI
jgi:hypothetical protein